MDAPIDQPIAEPMAEQIVSVDLTQRARQTDWNHARQLLFDKRTGPFMGALAFQEVDYAPLDRTLRQIVNLVDVRLNRTDALRDEDTSKVRDYIPPNEVRSPGKVLVQPRGSYASRTSLRGHVDLDLDLVFPDNYKIVVAGANEEAPRIERRISQVLGCRHPFADPPGEGYDLGGNLIVTKDGLRMVMLYVWGRLKLDDYVLPNWCTADPFVFREDHRFDNLNLNFPSMRIHEDKTLAELTRSISAQITNVPGYDPEVVGQNALDLDFFIKIVTKRFGGEEVLVGVDKNGPLGIRQYQTTTFIPSGKDWINSNRLLPIDRVALMTLKWWKNSFATDDTFPPEFEIRDPLHADHRRPGVAADVKLKSHHFLAALNALHELPPTNPLHIPNYSYLPFSLIHVMDAMIKILTFLNQSYQPAVRFNIAYNHRWSQEIPEGTDIVNFPFPQISLGVCEVLYKQIASDIAGYDAIINSKVIPDFIKRLQTALENLRQQDPRLVPGTYAYEELS